MNFGKGEPISTVLKAVLTLDLMSKHALEELIARLRKKFKSVQAEGDEPAIKSVWGVGYQLCVRINFVH